MHANDGQRDVSYEYAGQGRLVRRRQAGTELRLHYDLEGRLTGVDNEHNESYRFELDLLGQVVTEIGFDGLTRHYGRDAAGRVVAIQRPAARYSHYTYNAAGHLTEVRHHDGTAVAYTYDASGAPVEVRTSTSVVQLERNAQGQVISEIQNGVIIESTYDALGQRTHLHSSLGAALTLERGLLGEVTQLRSGDWFGYIERDVRGLELHRALSNGVHVGWQRDAIV